jgi:hypothetical protein
MTFGVSTASFPVVPPPTLAPADVIMFEDEVWSIGNPNVDLL